MENFSPVSWVPSGIFSLLGLYFLNKAVRKKAMRSWGWGRTGAGAPISRVSYAVLAVTFLDIAAMLGWSPGSPPNPLIILFLVCFVTLLVAGFLDTRAYRRRSGDKKG
jgi:hypothetical protein